MKLLTFQADRFAWRSAVVTLPELADAAAADSIEDAVVVFAHAEAGDEEPEAAERALRHAVKHVKWLANKRGLPRVALHSFTHLGGENAAPAFAREWLRALAAKLASAYEVKLTPFGWSCAWDLSVLGDPIAKVWKQIGVRSRGENGGGIRTLDDDGA